MRLATQKLIAARPALKMSDALGEQIDNAIMAVMDGLSPQAQQTLVKRIGPVLENAQGQPLQMTMKLEPGFLTDVMDPGQYRDQGIGVVPGVGGALSLLESRPKQIRETGFGWSDPSGKSVRLNYKDPDPVLRAAIKDSQFNYHGALQAAHAELMQEAGLQRGDLLMNSPYGLGRRDESGKPDITRAVNYMRQGFGAADGTKLQVAQLGPGRSLNPVQMYTTHPQLMEMLGLKQAWA